MYKSPLLLVRRAMCGPWRSSWRDLASVRPGPPPWVTLSEHMKKANCETQAEI